ncbi:protein lin-10-like isoform X5 [Artemia franciscana]|uniref:protein lin-10-like isoform X5 n=1 Tax=Artemia franciscana TaxID=6661 RepID=UPI0032DACE4F
MVEQRKSLKISLTDSEFEDAIEQLFPRCKPKIANSVNLRGSNILPTAGDFVHSGPRQLHDKTCQHYQESAASPLEARRIGRRMRPKSSRPRIDRRFIDRHRRANRLTRLRDLQVINSPNERYHRPLSWDGSESVDSVEFQKFSPNDDRFPSRARNHACGTVIYDDISENKFRETDSDDESECQPYARRFNRRSLGLLKSFSSEEISSLSESGGLTSQTQSEAGTPVRNRNSKDKQKIVQYDKSPRRYGARTETNGITAEDVSSPEYLTNGRAYETSPEYIPVKNFKPGFAKRIESNSNPPKINSNTVDLNDFEQPEEVIQIQNKADGSYSLFQFSTSYPQENLSPCELLENPSLETCEDEFVEKEAKNRLGNSYVARRLAEPVLEEQAESISLSEEPYVCDVENNPPQPQPKITKERDLPVRQMYPYPDSSDFDSEVEVESDSGRFLERKLTTEVNDTKPVDASEIATNNIGNNSETKRQTLQRKEEQPQLDPLIDRQMQAIEETLLRTSIFDSSARSQSEPNKPEPKPSLATLRAMSQPPSEPAVLSPTITMTALPVQNCGSMPSTYIGPPATLRPTKPIFLPPIANGQLRASFNPFNTQLGQGVPIFPPALQADPRAVSVKPDYTKQVEQFLKSQSLAKDLDNQPSLSQDENLIGLSSTPPPPAPILHRSTTDDGLSRLADSGNSRCSSSSDRRVSVEAALNDIKQAIKSTKQKISRPRSLIVNNNNSKSDLKSPVWVPRNNQSVSKRYLRDIERNRRKKTREYQDEDDCEMDKLLLDDNKDENGRREPEYLYDREEPSENSLGKKKGKSKEVLIEGVLFRARYMGSTQLVCEGQPSKATRMMQAEEAVSRIKSPSLPLEIDKTDSLEQIGHSPLLVRVPTPTPDPESQLISGTTFHLRYLGSLEIDEYADDATLAAPLRSKKSMVEEAVRRVKAPDGEPQPTTEVDLFISTEKIMVLNTELKEIMMDHALRTISYIADIGDLVVLMARRRTPPVEGEDGPRISKTPRMVCHIFESEEAQFIAQSIGQAFQVAYMEFLKANGIEDQTFGREIDYQEVLNSQEIFGDELAMFSRKDLQKEVIVPKGRNEILGVVIVESGWGSMLPTVVIANLMPGGAAARCGQLNIGDQIIAINGISLVGLPLTTCQTYIKNSKSATVVKMTMVPCPPVVEVKIKRPDTKYQLGFSVQNGVICSLLRGGIAERGGVRVGHRIIEINGTSVVAVPHERIVSLLATSVGEIQMKTMPTSMFRLLTGQETPLYI